MPLKKGDRVMWSHVLPSVYGAGSVLRRTAVEALDQDAVPCTVVKVENEKGTLIRVKLDTKRKVYRGTDVKPDANQELVLTADELILITEEEK